MYFPASPTSIYATIPLQIAFSAPSFESWLPCVEREGKKILVHVILDLYPEEYASYVGAFYQEDKKRERRRNLEEAT